MVDKLKILNMRFAVVSFLKTPAVWVAVCATIIIAASGCASSNSGFDDGTVRYSNVGTTEDRAALFDDLVAKTMAREAFSPIKETNLGFSVESSMLELRDEFIAADTDDKLYYALVKLSAARRDAHLAVSPVRGGIQLDSWVDNTLEAPIRFWVDFGDPESYSLYVADTGRFDRADETNTKSSLATVAVGDRLLTINDWTADAWFAEAAKYLRYSTTNTLWRRLAETVSERGNELPAAFFSGDSVSYGLGRPDGSRYRVHLPYVRPESIRWAGSDGRNYEGFNLLKDLQTFDLYKHESLPVLVLDWYGFREDLVKDMDWLVDYAEENDLLDHALIFDATKARGGSKGAYAIQRLTPKPFKTTFGNLRISDIIEPFVADRRRAFRRGAINDAGVSEVVGDGSWLMDWLNEDVMGALERGDAYSTNVPFKLAHAPKNSDGILQPAEVHFRGPMVCLFSPRGGSHLDQFAAIVRDNDLCYSIGMPTGGYSNTWEWEEVISLPESRQRLATFMWSIGHTISPNGEIVEGNPSDVDEYIPQTAANHAGYHDGLLVLALQHLGY